MSLPFVPRFFLSILGRALFLLPGLALAEEDLTARLVQKPLDQITDRSTTALGIKALSIRPTEWRHGETQNFVYHYLHDATASSVASEAEFYYRVIAKELEKDTHEWERKCHIYIFEDPADWHQFQSVGGLEPWTGGIHSQGELFIPRYASGRLRNNALAHEVTHLIVFRFFGMGVPLWLNEGFAEYTASRWFSSYMRARGAMVRPGSRPVVPEDFIPLAQLTTLSTYPVEEKSVLAFYTESERLVRFLSAIDKHAFAGFLESMGKGARIETALDKAYGRRFLNTDALEKDFRPYASTAYANLQ